MSTAELFSAALALKPKLRGELIKALLDSIDNEEPPPVRKRERSGDPAEACR